jgi:hypothetical protein
MRRFAIIVSLILVFLLSASAAFATPNSNVTIVNPVSGQTIYAESLLVSVKVTAPMTVRVLVTQEFKVVGGENTTVSIEEYLRTESRETASVNVGQSESFTSTNNLSFYTKKVDSIKPGVYKITVSTIDAEGKVSFTNTSHVEIKPREENPAEITSEESQQSGPAQFLRGLLRIIFGE